MPKVLVVDDEGEIAELLADELRRAGLEAQTASNGRAAYELVVKGGIDAILSDVRMPGGDGVELLSRVRLQGLTMPFAFMSAFADLTRERAQALGAQGLFQKPYEIDELVRFLNQAIARSVS